MAIAIIAEYNPFHNGHIYQINYVKEKFPGEKIHIILSGNYVQRGEIAIASFEKRKKIALEYGADYVHELEFEYASQAAHIFAKGALAKINSLQIDKLIFGSETNDINEFINIAKIIKDNKSQYQLFLKENLKKGLSFPKASSLASQKITGKYFQMPNDILGFEYVKQIIFNNYKITAFCHTRTNDYKSDKPSGKYASSTLIRKMIFEGKDVSKYTPMIFEKKPIRIEDLYFDFQTIIFNKTAQELRQFKLVSEGIENLFKKHINEKSYDDFVDKVNSKRYTSSRIKRIILYILLGIKN
ncbi:nucleotidyltransferase [Mycoplasmopsis pulmonis]|uniref:nucleotidyltransferase n=1 Tax=Mycoplasmopsis pulmonis TaxID=2107 RepID=UPI0010050FA8|nr:nucleotidyltransferase [Mycoplasmopsis pulmonis]VEU68074.1 Protein of uncharacterised function (DUF795) [Mycoplasmopsis pulmonis]